MYAIRSYYERNDNQPRYTDDHQNRAGFIKEPEPIVFNQPIFFKKIFYKYR